MAPDDPANRLLGFIRDSLSPLPGILSLTPVGSLFDGSDPERVGDIDIVVIFESLTKDIFNEAVTRVSTAVPERLGLGPRRVLVNPTFGPQKLDSSGTVVFHLMMYDLFGHIEHVEKSPFTCLDWERYPAVLGKSLTELYPVLRLFPADFRSGRRGISDYLSDIASGVLSVRQYEWKTDECVQTVKKVKLDPRQAGEFAYHIIRNGVSNYAKMVFGENERLEHDDLVSFWSEWLPQSSRHIQAFEMIRRAKLDRTVFPADSLDSAGDFIADMAADIDRLGSRTRIEFVLMRHLETESNDGTFLGQGRDPDILPGGSVQAGSFDRVYSSPALRALSSCKVAAPGQNVDTDERLLEQDCGKAEGMTFEQLRAEHPAIVEAWLRDEDAAFPGGETQTQVSERALRFLREKSVPPGRALVMTHNALLRGVIGSIMQVPRPRWYRIRIPHGEPFLLDVVGDHLIPALTPDQRRRLREDVR